MKRRELPGRIGAVAIAIAIVSAVSGVARADDKLDQARGHYQRGVALFDQHKYKEAIAEFAAADGLSPSPILEYNMALCYDRLGDRPEALRRYRLYLKRVPDAQNRSQVEAKIARLEKEIASASSSESSDPGYKPLPDSGDAPSAEHGDGAAAGSAGGPPADTPHDDDGGAAAGGTSSAPAPNPAPAPSDPELARAARVDVASIRDQRGFGAAQSAEAAGDEPAETGAPPPAAPADEPAPTPIYKRWWFWVVVGVSALILIDIAASGNGSSDTQPAALRALDPSLGRSMAAPSSGGLTIRF